MKEEKKWTYHLVSLLGLCLLLFAVGGITTYNRISFEMHAPPTPIPAARAAAMEAQCEAWNARVVSSHWRWDSREGLCRVVVADRDRRE